jgi:hypothetical protein
MRFPIWGETRLFNSTLEDSYSYYYTTNPENYFTTVDGVYYCLLVIVPGATRATVEILLPG